MEATVFLNIDLIEQPVLIQYKLLLEAITSHILRDEILQCFIYVQDSFTNIVVIKIQFIHPCIIQYYG